MGDGYLSTPELLETSAAQAARLPTVRAAFLLAFAATALWLSARLLLALHVPPHAPGVQDEFSYLLGADTFLHGRLANPPHPMGRFFESPHILIRPTYASKYPPGEAAWLALGKSIFGSTNAALVLQGGCLVFLLALTFCAWTHLPVAALMTMIAGCTLLRTDLHWTYSYWGPGSAAAIGAAFVLLGLGCFLRTRRTDIPGVLMALGAMQLFFTRPYEGGVLCVAVVACTPWLARRSDLPGFRSSARLALWAAPVLILGFAWNAYYDKAVTGHALELPYLLHDKTYNVAPVFCFVPVRQEPKYGNQRLAAQHGLHGWEMKSYRESCSSRAWLAYTFLGTSHTIGAMLFPVLPVLLLFPLSRRDLRCQALLLISGACILSVAVEVWQFSHYLAPAFVTIFLYCACLLDRLAQSPRVSAWMWHTVMAGLMLIAVGRLAVKLRTIPIAQDQTSFGMRRAQLLRDMSKLEGQQLVVVRYPDPNACIVGEWVYNGADPDNQKVVLAHDLGPAEDRVLFSYYKNRRKWLLTAGCHDSKLQPFPGADSSQIGQ